MDGKPGTARRAAPHQGRSRLGPRNRRRHAPRPREEGPGAAVRKHQGLQCRPLHQAVCQRARLAFAAGAGARLPGRRGQSRTRPACDEDEPRDHCAGLCRYRAGERGHPARRCDRPERISGAEMALSRRRPLYPHLLRHRHQGSRHRRDECRPLPRHDRPQKHRAVSADQRRPALGRAFRQMGGARPADAGRLHHRLGSDHGRFWRARHCRRASANGT